MSTTTTTTNATSRSADHGDSCNLEQLCAIDDIFRRHVVPYLAAPDASRLERTSQAWQQRLRAANAWKVLCQRDYKVDECVAPVYNAQRRSFDTLLDNNSTSSSSSSSSYKIAYQHWHAWEKHTHKAAKASDMVRAIRVWKRFKDFCRQHNLDSVLNSLCPCPPREFFRDLIAQAATTTTESSSLTLSCLVAFLSIHGGQEVMSLGSSNSSFFAGALGSYTCYDSFYSMRLLNVVALGSDLVMSPVRRNLALVAMSPGNPRYFLCLQVADNDDHPEGTMILLYNDRFPHHVVGRGGILSYFETYVERLESGTYPVRELLPLARGISLFADKDTGNDGRRTGVSTVVTRGIRVRASARWFPGAPSGGGLNFGYSIRIQRVPATDAFEGTCQLVGRHWQFTDGNGRVRRVDGDGVIGKQPLFFWNNNDNSSGFVDLGPAGDEERYENKEFCYQSQSGPVAGTSPENTGSASVQGTFSFVRGSIENPEGPIFHVAVGPFPLSISLPFY